MNSFYPIAIDELRTIDWSFSTSSSNGHITGLHPYPARFIPQIPRSLIKSVKLPPNANILDPFGGCGTSIVEALNAGYNAYGIDVNELAILLQRVYTHQYTKADFLEYKSLFELVLNNLHRDFVIEENYLSIPNVDHWFSSISKNMLMTVMYTINNSTLGNQVLDLAKFTVSRIVVRVSNQQSDTQYRSVEKNIDKKKIIRILNDSFKEVLTKFQNLNREWTGKAEIIKGDSRDKESYKNISGVDLIVTSPPYPNAYEYWLYHKYRMFWLNLDPIWSRSKEIGARPYYSGSGKLNEFDFQRDISRVLVNLRSASKDEVVQFWLVGDSIIKGRLVDNTQLIIEACDETGWKVISVIPRNLIRARSSFQGIGRQIKEDILIIVKN